MRDCGSTETSRLRTRRAASRVRVDRRLGWDLCIRERPRRDLEPLDKQTVPNPLPHRERRLFTPLMTGLFEGASFLPFFQNPVRVQFLVLLPGQERTRRGVGGHLTG